MKTILLHFFFSLATLCFLTQCAKEEPKPKPESSVTAVGRISSVSPDKKIILIEKFTPGSLPDELIYSSQGSDGRTASIKPTGERIRNFHAADLINGTPAVGDAVYSRRLEESPPSTDLTSSEDAIKPTKTVVEIPKVEPVLEPFKESDSEPPLEPAPIKDIDKNERTLEKLAEDLPQS